MNLLFITYQGDIAGSTNSIEYLTRGLADAGHNVYVGCRTNSLLWSKLSGSLVSLVPMTFKSRIDFKNMAQIKDAVEKYNIHVINAQSSKDRYTSIFARWLYQLPVKVVHTRRQISKSCGGLQSWFYQQGTHKIIAVSKGVKDSLIDNGIRDNHVHVIYNGTPSTKYDDVSKRPNAELACKLDIQEGDFVIGCISRRKCQDQLLKAVGKLDYKVKLIFIGIEPTQQDLDIISQSKVAHDIYFEGMMSNEQVLEYYNFLDVCVLPSTMEGLSQSLLEAMFLKVPVIATAAAGNLDLITHQKNGLLFENNNIDDLESCLTAVKTNTVDLKTMIDNAYFNASNNFSQKNTVDNYEAFFEELLDEKSRDTVWALD